MDITKKIGPWREVGKRLLVITIYSIIMALNYKSFVQAGDLFPGGFTGLTRLAQRCALCPHQPGAQRHPGGGEL